MRREKTASAMREGKRNLEGMSPEAEDDEEIGKEGEDGDSGGGKEGGAVGAGEHKGVREGKGNGCWSGDGIRGKLQLLQQQQQEQFVSEDGHGWKEVEERFILHDSFLTCGGGGLEGGEGQQGQEEGGIEVEVEGEEGRKEGEGIGVGVDGFGNGGFPATPEKETAQTKEGADADKGEREEVKGKTGVMREKEEEIGRRLEPQAKRVAAAAKEELEEEEVNDEDEGEDEDEEAQEGEAQEEEGNEEKVEAQEEEEEEGGDEEQQEEEREEE